MHAVQTFQPQKLDYQHPLRPGNSRSGCNLVSSGCVYQLDNSVFTRPARLVIRIA